MTEPSTPKAKAWTDTEKVGYLFQIISKMNQPIPWKELELTEGRTLKAVQIMIDKEKTRIKQAQAAAGGGALLSTPAASGKKRAAAADGKESKAKKARAPRKKTTTPSSAPEDDDDEENTKVGIKPDLTGDELI